jgi:uncharacterized protein YcbK (DUF882 family)
MPAMRRNTEGILEEQWDRRRVLKVGGIVALGCLLPGVSLAEPGSPLVKHKSLAFFNTHTGEHQDIAYWAQGRYLPDGLAAINRMLRDFRTGEIKSVDVRLLDLLHMLSTRFGANIPFHVISGYRSPKTNAMLCRRGTGVARRSLHMAGKAIDVRVPDLKLAKLRDAALDLRAGGVGYYPRSNFVHLDVGPVRHW